MTLLETVASVGVVGIMVAVGVPWCRTPPSHSLHAPPQLRHLFVRGVSALASAMLLMLEPCAGHGAFHPSGSPSRSSRPSTAALHRHGELRHVRSRPVHAGHQLGQLPAITVRALGRRTRPASESQVHSRFPW